LITSIRIASIINMETTAFGKEAAFRAKILTKGNGQY
jgi:hypothetical protein